MGTNNLNNIYNNNNTMCNTMYKCSSPASSPASSSPDCHLVHSEDNSSEVHSPGNHHARVPDVGTTVYDDDAMMKTELEDAFDSAPGTPMKMPMMQNPVLVNVLQQCQQVRNEAISSTFSSTSSPYPPSMVSSSSCALTQLFDASPAFEAITDKKRCRCAACKA